MQNFEKHTYVCFPLQVAIANKFPFWLSQLDRLDGRAVTRSTLGWKVKGSNLGPVKPNTVLPTARHRCDISSKGAVLPAGAITRRWAASTRYTLRRINERFDLLSQFGGFEQAANSVDKEFEEIHRNIRSLEIPKQVRIPSSAKLVIAMKRQSSV